MPKYLIQPQMTVGELYEAVRDLKVEMEKRGTPDMKIETLMTEGRIPYPSTLKGQSVHFLNWYLKMDNSAIIIHVDTDPEYEEEEECICRTYTRPDCPYHKDREG